MQKCEKERQECEKIRHENLFEIGNWLHESVVVSNDEVMDLIGRNLVKICDALHDLLPFVQF